MLNKLVAAIKKFLRVKKSRRKKRPFLKQRRSFRRRPLRKKRTGQIRRRNVKRRFKRRQAVRKIKTSKRSPIGRRPKSLRRGKTSLRSHKSETRQRQPKGRPQTGFLKKAALSPKATGKQDSPSPGAIVGEITHYFSKIEVVVVKITRESIRVGDRIRIKGKTTDFTQRVASIQIESVNVPVGRKGQLIGLKVEQVAKEGDLVYKIKEKPILR